MMEKFKPYAMLLAGLTALALLWNYFKSEPPAPVGVYVDAKDSPDVSKLKKSPVQGSINVLPPAAKRKTGLPQAVQDDQKKHVVDTAQFPIGYQPFTAVVVYDESSGDVSIAARNDPLPWIAAERRSFARVGYGIKTHVGGVGQLAIGGNFVQTKALHIGASAELFTDGTGYAGAHVEYQW